MAYAEQPLIERIKGLEPIIGAHPPNIRSREEFESVKKRYDDLKAELDGLVRTSPKDQSLLFMRGYLQSMGHNFDYPGAWQGATDDLKAVLNSDPGNIPALVELGKLWVNSDPALAPNAENLFRGAQCYKGSEPLEEAQKGLFFALYYQGKIREALRQSEYLKQTWPQNQQYQQLNEMTRAVLSRRGDDKALTPTKVALASCDG
jgi:hypothetical protein